MNRHTTWSRREFLRRSALAASIAATGDLGTGFLPALSQGTRPVRRYALDAVPLHVHLDGKPVTSIGYNGILPGPVLRARQGDQFHATVHNRLSSATTVHWHGIPILNRMDGVPGVTQTAIAPGATFDYDFPLDVAGTYWYHSHSGIQNDRGLYGPLIIEPQRETLHYDREFTVMIDDWIDGVQRWSGTQSDHLYTCQVRPSAVQGAPPHLTGVPPAQPVRYPLFLINGHTPANPAVFEVKRGDVVRLRLINASAASTVRVAIAGHRMRVTHADGLAVVPVDVDVLEIGMAERYDVLVYATNPGVWQLGVTVNGEGMRTRALMRYRGSHSAVPPASMEPRSFRGKLLDYSMLRASPDVGQIVPRGKPDLTIPIDLHTRFGSFWLTFNGEILPSDQPFHIPRDRHIRFVVSNSGSTEVHPMHLHGHSFKVTTPQGGSAMKDTVKVYPFQTVTLDWISNNPGLWVLHCHNLYHMMAGMMQVLQVS